MKVNKKVAIDSAILRKKAEELVKSNLPEKKVKHSDVDTLKIVYELEVHQIELELMYEELRNAIELSEKVSQKYSELYNFAPLGYYTLSRAAKILELNLVGAQMLGKERTELNGSSFGFFISDETKPIFNLFIKKIFSGNSKETCEVILLSKSGKEMHVHLTGIKTENEEHCVVNAVDISELRQIEIALRKSEEHNRAIILQTAMDGFWLSDMQGSLLEVNETYCRMSGYTMQELLTMHISDLDVVETVEETLARMKKIISQGEDRFETQHRGKDGSIIEVEVSVQFQPINGGRFVSFLHDITERKTAERYREMTREILQILNEPGDIFELIKRILDVLKSGTGFDAVGIRLQKGDDYPYVAQNGFSRDFLLTENSLVEFDKDGRVCRDKNKNVSLECTCGMVISGRNDKNNQILTLGGSFWTNDSFTSMKTHDNKNARLNPRNRCIYHGYASLAIVPIRNKDSIVGLLQFNDRHKDRFSQVIVEKLEGIASHIGAAIMRKQAEETLRESEKRRLAILDTAMDGFWLFDKLGFLLEVNDTYCRMSGYTNRELRSMHISEIEVVETDVDIATHIQTIINHGEDRFESRHRRKDGSIFDVEVSVQYQEDEGGQFVAFLHDITERKRAEESLIDSENRYRSLFEESNDAIFLVDLYSGMYIDCNRMAETLTGYTHDEIIQMRSGTLLANHHKGELASNMEIIRSGKVLRSETEIITKSGKLVPVEFNSSTLTINKKQCILSLLHDISERKATEERLNKLNEELEDRVKQRTFELQKLNSALQQAEEKYRTVADFTYRWEFWIDENNIMLYCSPSCERITGYKASEFVQNPRLLFSIIHPDDLNIFLTHEKNEKNALDSSVEIQFRIIRLDGKIRWIGHICQPVYNDSGNFIGSRGSNNDITDRKRIEDQLKTSNHKYKLLSSNISDGIFMCHNGNFEYVNKSLNILFGYHDHELEGMSLIQLIMPDFKPEVATFLEQNGPTDQYRNIEIECRKKDQTTMFVEIFMNYVAKQGYIYGVIHDITEKKLIQKSILKAIIQTEENEKSNFSKELHDGLGPLLSTIKLYLQWSERPKSNKSRTEIIHKAEQIIEDALATVKEISNKLSPHLLSYYGLTSAIQSFVDKLDESSTFKIVFQSNVTRRFDMEIESAIYRATIECINNSIKYANADNILIILSDTDTQLTLQYIDDGIGFNLEETISIKKGLGLFNLQNRIKTIGGKITMNSEPGKGVKYHIVINV